MIMQYIYYLEMMISKHLFSPNEQIVEEQSNIQKKKKRSLKYLVCLILYGLCQNLIQYVSCYVSALFEIHSKEFKVKMAQYLQTGLK